MLSVKTGTATITSKMSVKISAQKRGKEKPGKEAAEKETAKKETPARKRKVGRPRAHPGATDESARDAILRAAQVLFRSQGIRATTTRQLAEMAGLRQPTIFHYFKNKTAIAREIAARAVAPELDFIGDPALQSAPVHERLYLYARFVAMNLRTNPNVIGSPLQFPELLQRDFEDFHAAYGQIFSTLEETLSEGVAAGVFIDLPVAVTARQLFALIESGLTEPRLPPHQAAIEAENAARLVLRAVLKDMALLDCVPELSKDE